MADWSAEGYALTAAGRRLQAKVESGVPLELTRMKIGSGTETGAEVDALIDLVLPEANVTISNAVVEGETCTVTGTLLFDTLDHGFWAREWGLFARDPDDGEILYMIALDSQPDWISANAEAGTSNTYSMKVVVANGTEITANVDLTGLIEVEQLEQTAHSLRRLTAYKEGDILNAPNLPHGLVLECITAGTTAETLIDFSSVKCGDIVTDGGVVWRVVRYLITASDSTLYKDFVSFVGCMNTVVKALAKTSPPIYAGVVSPTEPSDTEKVWIKTEAGDAFDLTQMRLVTNDGETIENPLTQVKADNGDAVYLDPTGEIPAARKVLDVFDGGKFNPDPVDTDFATDEEVQEVLDETLPLPSPSPSPSPSTDFATDEEVEELLDDILPLPGETVTYTATGEQMEEEEGGF